MSQGSQPDLGDVAARLMQADAADIDSLAELAGLLARFIADATGVAASVKKLAGAAQGKLDAVIKGSAGDPEQALASAVRLVCLATSPDALPRGEGELDWDAEPAPRARRLSLLAPSMLPARSPTLLPVEPDLDLIGEFLTEANEHVVNAEAALLTLEENPDDAAAVNTVFRAFHTVKGVSAMLGMTALAELAHHAESLLARIRDGQLRCTGVYANLCLRGIDSLKDTLAAVAAQLKGQDATLPAGYAELVRDLQHPEAAAAKIQAAAGAARALLPAPSEPAQVFAPAPAVPSVFAPGAHAAPVAIPCAPRAVSVAGVPTASAVAPPAAEPATVAVPVRTAAPAPAAAPAPVAAPAAVAAPPGPVAASPAPKAEAEASRGAASDESSVRVRTDRLDRLIDMVGELVIAHSMLAQDPRNDVSRDPELSRKVGHAGKIVRELQDMSMSLRMVPLRPTFQKLIRIVRDVAKKSDKQIQFQSTGDDTEIDRNMVDVIAEPLIHMVRNAADHGIESTAKRVAAGKPPVGTVRLAAYHSGGSVVIDLSDDGGGLDRDRILAKAAQKGLIDPNKSLSDSEIFQLIFLPGFSTTENVTDISGRGVGMDVVRRNIEQLKGRIDITSERGKGTVFSIRLPLTLAITDGMIVRVGPERYIIPTVNIAMNFRPEASQVSTVVGRGEVILLRGELIPLFRLHHLFKVSGAVEEPTRGLVVVLRDGVSSCGLLVDELLGQQQVVAKSLGSAIGKVAAVSGGAILGDGRVGLILDPASLVTLAKESRAGRPQSTPDARPIVTH
jgi:two-component system chemotaxis sensor kinase CheA